ncbi:MAG: AfsR/SARP family transcriptional regulator [Chloroflexia bacterium]
MGSNGPEDLSIRLLGGFEVAVDGRALEDAAWSSRKAADLVKLLALGRGHTLHREQAMEALWPQLAPEAAGNLRKALHHARRVLASGAPANAHPFIGSRDEFLLLRAPGELWVDVDAFREAAALARRSSDLQAHKAAIALYGGDLLPEVPYEEWAIAPREELRGTFLSLLAQAAQLYEGAGDLEAAIETLERAFQADPLNEDISTDLMRLTALVGRRGQALKLFRQLKEGLRKELDAEPQETTQSLYLDIEAGRFPGSQKQGPVAAQAPRTPPPRVMHNLLVQLTSFVGRKAEMDEIERLLSPHAAPHSSLLTLTGPGGSGKTRLAIEIASKLVQSYADGVWLVELAGVSNSDLVPQAVASALRVRDQPERSLVDTLSEYLYPRHLLLLLDNCEHVIEACAGLVNTLLRACPRLQILATSRERLNIPGETTWLVPPLTAPDHDLDAAPDSMLPSQLLRYEAAQLFADRAALASSTFRLDSHNALAVAQICRRLDGIPLAIELAAARVRMLSAEQIVERLDHSFLLLNAGSRTALPRHQTLRATVDWSFSLLDPRERTLFCRLSVFAGGFDLEAVEEVCSDETVPHAEVLDILSHLIDKSLVVVVTAGSPLRGITPYELRITNSPARYRLLETLRQYGRERLAESDDEAGLLARHARYFAVLCAEANPQLYGPAQMEWFNKLNTELDNLRVALDWCRAHDPQLGLLLAGSLSRFWDSQGYVTEMRKRLNELLEIAPPGTPVRARALYTSGFLASRQGDNVDGSHLLKESLALFTELGDEAGMATALERLGVSIALLGNYEQGVECLERSVVLFRKIDYKSGLSWALGSTGMVVRGRGQGEYERALGALTESSTLAREIGDLHTLAFALNNLGQLARTQGDFVAARALLDESLELARRMNNKPTISWTLESLATVVRMSGDYRAGWPMLKESLQLAREIGYNRHLARCIYTAAIQAVLLGSMENGVRLFAAVDRLHPAARLSLDEDEKVEWDQSLETARDALDGGTFIRLWTEGEALSWDQASEIALNAVSFDNADS